MNLNQKNIFKNKQLEKEAGETLNIKITPENIQQIIDRRVPYVTPESELIRGDKTPEFVKTAQEEGRAIVEAERRRTVTEAELTARREAEKPITPEPVKELTRTEQIIEDISTEIAQTEKGLERQKAILDELRSRTNYPIREYKETNIPILETPDSLQNLTNMAKAEREALTHKPIATTGLSADLEIALNKDPAVRTQLERVKVDAFSDLQTQKFIDEFIPVLKSESINPTTREQVKNEIKTAIENRQPRSNLEIMAKDINSQ